MSPHGRADAVRRSTEVSGSPRNECLGPFSVPSISASCPTNAGTAGDANESLPRAVASEEGTPSIPGIVGCVARFDLNARSAHGREHEGAVIPVPHGETLVGQPVEESFGFQFRFHGGHGSVFLRGVSGSGRPVQSAPTVPLCPYLMPGPQGEPPGGVPTCSLEILSGQEHVLIIVSIAVSRSVRQCCASIKGRCQDRRRGVFTAGLAETSWGDRPWGEIDARHGRESAPTEG